METVKDLVDKVKEISGSENEEEYAGSVNVDGKILEIAYDTRVKNCCGIRVINQTDYTLVANLDVSIEKITDIFKFIDKVFYPKVRHNKKEKRLSRKERKSIGSIIRSIKDFQAYKVSSCKFKCPLRINNIPGRILFGYIPNHQEKENKSDLTLFCDRISSKLSDKCLISLDGSKVSVDIPTTTPLYFVDKLAEHIAEGCLETRI